MNTINGPSQLRNLESPAGRALESAIVNTVLAHRQLCITRPAPLCWSRKQEAPELTGLVMLICHPVQ